MAGVSDDTEFYRDLATPDELTVVIKSVIYIELQLERLICSQLIDVSSFRDMRLTFDQKVSLAVAVGLVKRLKGPLQAVARIRNKYAHRLDATLGKQEVDNLYQSLDPYDREVVHNAHRNRVRLSAAPIPENFRERSPLDQFVVIAIAMRAALLAAVSKAESP